MDASHRERFVVVVANLVPLLGFVAFDASTTIFLGVLVLDIWATAAMTVWKIPFAERRPPTLHRIRGRIIGALSAKRGGFRPVSRLPPIYPRNVPMLFASLAIGLLLAIASFVLYALPDPDITPRFVGWVLLGGFVVFVVRAYETWQGYFREGGYRRHSARTVGLESFYQLVAVVGAIVLVLLGSVLVGNGEAPFVGEFTLVAIAFLGKFAADLRAWQLSSSPERRGWLARIYGSPDTELGPASVSMPEGPPADVIRPSRRATVLDAFVRGGMYVASVPGLFVLALLVLGAMGSRALLWLGLFGLATVVSLRAAVRYLAIGTVEYRFFDDVVVAYDRFLEEPQSRLEYWAVTDVDSPRDVVDLVCRTETLTLDTTYEPPGQNASLLPDPQDAPVPDPDANRPLTLYHLSAPTPVRDRIQGESTGAQAASRRT